MKKFPRILVYILIGSFVFVFGWESSTYYHSKKLTETHGTQINSVFDTLPSLIPASNTEADLSMFWKVWDTLHEIYVDESAIDQQQMVYGAIKGMVAALNDPYTVYMTPTETKEFNQNLQGELEGIGAELTVKDQALVVANPLKNSPAEKAGLMPGDIVYKIDGSLTSEMTLFDAITKIRGPKGTKVTLTIIRKGIDNPFDLSIEREKVDVKSVSMEEKDKGIFHISINQFNDNTKPEFEDNISQLLLKDPKGIILDLRNNGGGYLDTAVDMLSEFLGETKTAVIVKRREEKDTEVVHISGNPRLPTIPLVVLINDGSASASEIVAGGIQDYKRGLIMGEQSFGKGSVQEVDQLSDGSSLRLTIAKWYTPNDKNIDKVGITPDMVVKMSNEDFEKNRDPQLDAAVDYLKKL